MNYNEIFDKFKTTYVGKEIKKNIILDKLSNADDKEIIERFIINIYIMYSVKAEIIDKKAEENFEEIQIIEIDINDYRAVYDIYGILLSIIPYPILAIFKYKDKISLAVSNRILSENKNNKGKIYTSYFIKEEDISSYLNINIEHCQTMIDVYNEWISNIGDILAYYERLDRIMLVIEYGFHLKSDEVLDKLENYIVKYCDSYNMKPKDGWKNKLEKYSDNLSFEKKVEIHSLWEYLSENTFLRNQLEDFADWNEFKEACAYNNNLNNMYYSQYDSSMSDENELNITYKNVGCNKYKSHNVLKVEKIPNEPTKRNDIDNTIQEIVEEVKEKGSITDSELIEMLIKKFDNANKKIIKKILDAFEENNIEILEDDEQDDAYDDEIETSNNEFSEKEKQILQELEDNFTALAHADYEIRNNKEFMLQAIKIDSLSTKYASDKLKNNKEFMMQAIKEDGLNIEYASEKLRNNEDFILEAAKIDNICLIYASDRLKNDKDFMLLINEVNGRNLAYASDELKNNKEFILEAAEQSLWALAFATDELRDDKEFVSQIVEKNSWTLKHASDRLKNDKDVVLKSIKKDGWFLVYARNELRSNREFLLEAINNNKECMAFANNNLKNEILSDMGENKLLKDEQKDNEEYMLQLIKKDYFNIRFVSERLKNDSNFMLKSMKTGDMGFKCLAYASDELKANKDFILKVFKEIGNYTFALVSEKLKCNKEFILKLLELNYLDFAYVSYELRSDKEFMMNAIYKNAETIEFACYELRNDKEFVLKSIKINPLCFAYASDELKNNKEFMLQAIYTNYGVIEHAKDIFKDDKDVVLAALKIDNYGITLSRASDRLKNDKDFMLQVVDINIKALKFLGDKLRNDSDFILKAFEKDNRSLAYASDELKNDKDFMLKIDKINENTMILEYNSVPRWFFLARDAEFYGLNSLLENDGIHVLEKDEFSMKIVDTDTGRVFECNHTPLSEVTRIINELETDGVTYYILNWKLHLADDTQIENLKKIDSYMRSIKLEYNIYQIKNNEKKTIIEHTREDIEIQEKNEPLCLYMNKYTKKEENNIIVKINEIKPHIILYLSNMINMLANNNNIKYSDYIAIINNRNSFGKTWTFLMKNDIKYIFKYRMEIYKIPEKILKQIEEFLKGFDVKYYIQKIFDDVILTMYPKNKEVISFVYDVLDLNNVEYDFDSYASTDEIDSAGTSLWMFETSKEEKEEISKILSEPDQAKVNRLKELGAPEIIIKNELEPEECNFGVIIDASLQNQIENILQSLKLKYTILDENENIIKEQDE